MCRLAPATRPPSSPARIFELAITYNFRHQTTIVVHASDTSTSISRLPSPLGLYSPNSGMPTYTTSAFRRCLATSTRPARLYPQDIPARSTSRCSQMDRPPPSSAAAPQPQILRTPRPRQSCFPPRPTGRSWAPPPTDPLPSMRAAVVADEMAGGTAIAPVATAHAVAVDSAHPTHSAPSASRPTLQQLHPRWGPHLRCTPDWTVARAARNS